MLLYLSHTITMAIVAFDIETAAKPFASLSENEKKVLSNLYESKWKSVQRGIHVYLPEMPEPSTDDLKEFHLQNSAFNPYLSDLLCISFWREKEWVYSSVTYDGTDLQILDNAYTILNKNHCLLWHNIIWFDIPYLQKKYMIHNKEVPTSINTHWQKPWDVKHKDTMYIYRWWEYLNMSLENVCYALEVSNPKEGEIKWSEISRIYDTYTYIDWSDFFDNVKKYCERDVSATYKLYKKMKDTYTSC